MRLYRMGPFELDARAGELRKHGVRVRLQEQPLRILEMLLLRRGQVVLREEIREKLWTDGTSVEFDRGINAAIRRLRTALGDSAKTPRYIETCGRRGYRLMASVEAGVPTADLNALAQAPTSPAAGRADRRESGHRRIFAWVAAGVLTLTVLLLASLNWGPWPLGTAERSLVVFPPVGSRFSGDLAVSADGRQLAAPVVDSSGTSKLWVRSLSGGSGRVVGDTEGAARPFWYAGREWVGFFSRHQLYLVRSSGGPAQRIFAALGQSGGAWNADGTILFGPDRTGPLYQITPGVSSPVPATRLAEDESLGHTAPQFLEDGRRFLYLAATADPRQSSVFLGALDSPVRQRLLTGVSQIGYAPPDYLLFVRDGRLLARRFDFQRAEPVGPEQTLVTGNVVAFSASRDVLAYLASPRVNINRLVRYTKDGRLLHPIGEPDRYAEVFVSPDGKQAAVNLERGSSKLSLLRLDNEQMRAVASGPETLLDGVWSPDGKQLAYQVYGRQRTRIMVLNLADGFSRLLLDDGESNYPDAWSPDGKWILGRRTGGTVILLAADGKSRPQVLLDAPYLIDQMQFSRNGQWVVYNSDESGRWEVYAARFPKMDQAHKISEGGGCQPIWSPDGQQLFYLGLEGGVLSVRMTVGSVVPVGPARKLFQSKVKVNCSIAQYGVISNGDEFLAIEPAAEASQTDPGEPVRVQVNWIQRLLD